MLSKSLVRRLACLHLACGLSGVAHADPKLDLQGVVTIAAGVEIPSYSETCLYITAREDVGMWQSAIRSTKPPPLMAVKISPAKSFPLQFRMSTDTDLTLEATTLAKDWTSGNVPLTLSARLDTDGLASTRSPEDLVGRGNARFADGKWEDVSITLVGRGVTGKFVTSSSNK